MLPITGLEALEGDSCSKHGPPDEGLCACCSLAMSLGGVGMHEYAPKVCIMSLSILCLPAGWYVTVQKSPWSLRGAIRPQDAFTAFSFLPRFVRARQHVWTIHAEHESRGAIRQSGAVTLRRQPLQRLVVAAPAAVAVQLVSRRRSRRSWTSSIPTVRWRQQPATKPFEL